MTTGVDRQPALGGGAGRRLGASDRFLLATLAGTALGLAALLWLTPGGLSLIFYYLLKEDVPLAEASLLALLVPLVLGRRARALLWIPEWAARHARGVAIVAVLLLGLAARFVYHAHPFSMDEYAAWFQGRVFAAGRLTGSFPVQWMDRMVSVAFQNTFFLVSHTTGEVCSAYWPGFALLLAPFTLLGVPWLCNPVLSGLCLLALAATARRLAPDQPAAAGWALLLALVSPAFVALGISYYAMTSLMLANLVFTWGFLSGRPRDLFWSGVVGSVALFLHNPLPHLLFAIPWIVWLLGSRGLRREAAALACGYLPLSLLLGVGWVLLRARLHPTTDAAASGLVPAVAGVIRSFQEVFLLQPDTRILKARCLGFVKLWLWAAPGLLVLAAWGCALHRRRPAVVLFAASGVLTLLGFFLVTFDQGHGWGYRYFHSAWAVLPLLGALALVRGGSEEEDRLRFRGSVLALVAAGALVLVPMQLRLVDEIVGGQLALLPPPAADAARRLTLIYPFVPYSIDLVQNDPFLRGNEIRMLGTAREADDRFVQAYFPGAQEETSGAIVRVWKLPAARRVSSP